jgi:hypothetical protein
MFVGGALASQNGLGDFIPAKLLVRSAIKTPGDKRTLTADDADDADQIQIRLVSIDCIYSNKR